MWPLEGFGENIRPYLKNQSGYHHSANIAVNVDSMPPNLLKQLLHAISSMEAIVAFFRVPELESFFHILLNQ